MIKSVLLLAGGACLGVLLGWGIWGDHAARNSTVSSIPIQPIRQQILNPVPPVSITSVSPAPRPEFANMQILISARQKAFQDHPELVTEYKELLDEASNNEKIISAAMIKANPQVAPILAKLAAQRRPAGAQ